MKEGWEIKKLGEIAYIGLGFTHTPEYVESGVPFLSVKDISSGEICWENVKFVSQEEYDSAPKGAKPQKGDIMFCRVGTMGKPVIVTTDTPFCTFVSLGYLHLLNNNISNIYIKYWMQSNAFDIQVKANVKGVAIKNLNTGWLKEFTLPIPPIAEQEKIVAELDCLSGIIEKKKQQLKEYDALAQSIFYEMFGDPDDSEFPLLNLSSLSESKLSYGSGASAIEYDGKVRYIRITDIMEDGKLDKNAMSPNMFDNKYLLKDGDILFARSGATVGKTYHYRETDGVAIYAGYLIRFIPNQALVIPEYIYYYTRSPYYQAFVKKNAQAVAQPNINAKQYGDLKVCVPPLALQQEFALKIEAIEKQKALIKKSIEEVETLFNSRMDLYFN